MESERRFLKALVAYEAKPELSPRRRLVGLVVGWLFLVVALFVLFRIFGPLSVRDWGWLFSALLIGVGLGIYAIYDVQRSQWKYLRHYVNFKAAAERLSEIEKQGVGP